MRDTVRVQRTRAGVARFGGEARIALAEARHDCRRLMHAHKLLAQHAPILVN
jgi:hypothetical protein